MAFCLSARRALALALMAMIVLPAMAISVSAHVPSDPTPENDVFLIYRGENGDTVCRKANEEERRQLEVPRPQDLRQINHIDDTKQNALSAEAENDLPSHLTIILRATANLDANAPAKAAFIRAAANWENLVTSPVTIYIDVDFGPNNFGQAWPSGVLGSTSSPPPETADYAALRNSLIAGANTASTSAVYTGLPASSLPTDLGTVNSVSISKALARAIGFSDPTAPSTDNAARIGFNSGIVTYDFDPSDGVSGTDFEAVATHEIGHALGFTSRSGSNPISGLVTPAMWDLYRFRSGTTSATFASAQRIMTIGGPTPNSQYYFVPGATELGLSNGGPDPANDPNKSTNNSDGNQSSHWRQASLNGGVIAGYIGIMDPRIPSNTRRLITANDINALNIFGYNSNGVVTTTPANDNFASAQVIRGCSGTVTGTNVNATREAGEPVLFDPTSNRSVWYQWLSPVSGSVTITTAGSGFDTVLGVYTGNAVGSLTQIGTDDDDDPARTSTVTFTATGGTTYRIVVDGFNNGNSGGDAGPITLSWTASNCTGPLVQFSQSSYSVNEAAGSLNVTVFRTDDTSGPVSVNYNTSDTAGLTNCTVTNGIASERCDYGTTVGTLRFAAGETSKSIIIPIVNDALVEGNETFQVTLSSPVGATIGAPATVNVTILDNDVAPAAQNPIDDIGFFVTQQYIDFLGRLPDTVGFQNWVATLQGCPNGGFGENDNPNCDRVHVSAGFFLSPEFQGRSYFAYRFYEVALDRRPTYAEFVPDMALVGGPQSPESEALSKAAYTDAWMQRPEFKARYDSLSNTAYVNALEANAEVTVSNKATLVAALDGGQMNRGQVLRNIVESQAVADRFFNRAFVAMQYFGYLRRDPDTFGFQNWLNTLNADPTNFRHMIFGFLFSTEYRQRFGQ